MTRVSFLISLTCILWLAACGEDPATVVVPPRHQPQSLAELDYARATLNSIQEPSFDQNREFCGYIGVDSFGRFVATEPLRGRESTCRPRSPRGDFRVLASYHSHGAFSEDFDSEIPSYEDMTSDILEGVDGYIATPGGRMWYIDAATRDARLVCGPNCLSTDPGYIEPGFEPIRSRYSLRDLEQRSDY
jgi:hypothetical protein